CRVLPHRRNGRRRGWSFGLVGSVPGHCCRRHRGRKRVQHRANRAMYRSSFGRDVEKSWTVRLRGREAAEAFLAQGLIGADEAEEIVAQAAQSKCGSKAK